MMMFEKESVRSNSTPSPPRSNRRCFAQEGDKCFSCGVKGHWSRDCPVKKTNKTPTTPNSKRPSSDFPILQCPCGAGAAIVLLSKTENNPDRHFYRCPLSSVTKKCRFFKWCDSVTSSDEIISTPTCRCAAGACRIYKETSGPNAGRSFFVCPIKKGQGACNFVQPLDGTDHLQDEQLRDVTNDHFDEQLLDDIDEQLLDGIDDLSDELLDATNDIFGESTSSPQSVLTKNTSPPDMDLVEEKDVSLQGMGLHSPVAGTPEHPGNIGTISGLSTKEKAPPVDFQEQEDTSDEPLRKQCKRMRHGAPKTDCLVLDFMSDCWDMPQSKSRDRTMDKTFRADALIHQRQVKFLRQMSSAGASLPAASSSSTNYNSSALPSTREPLTQNYLETAAIYQILGFRFMGWYGRLLFPPSGSLTFPTPKPFFCGVFPCFDPIYAPQGANILDAEASTVEMHSPSSVDSKELFLLTPSQPLSPLLWEPSGLNSAPKILQGNIMNGPILEVFKQAAVRIQDGLLTILESRDFRDHESMLQDAYSVFGALEGLFVDYQPFKEHVIGFIGRAASLDELESSMDNDRSSQVLVDSCDRKKLLLEDISRRHAETSADLKASNEHLQYLQKEASRVNDMLLRIEKELSSCKVENMEIGTHFAQISEDKLLSELSLQVAFKEAEEAMKLYQQKEEERNVAKASYEKARSELRQSCNMFFLM